MHIKLLFQIELSITLQLQNINKIIILF